MARRLGGEFEISVADFKASIVGLPKAGAPRKHSYLVDTGRSALWLAADAVHRRFGRAEAWLPRYCCESVVEPFRALGYRVRWYAAGGDLASPAGLPAKLSGTAFLYIHYFGRRNAALEKYVAERRRAGDEFAAIEDCAQAALTSGVGAVGDYVVTSWRKLLPVPDGAVLACDVPVDAALAEADEGFVSRRALGKFLRGAGGDDADFLHLFEESEKRLRPDRPRAISWLSRRLLERVDAKDVGARRRRNWAALARTLKRALPEGCSPLFSSLADGEVPLGFPIRVPPRRRDALRAFLAKRRMYCPVHWALPEDAHANDGVFAGDLELSRSELTLSVDQRASAADMAALAAAVKTFFGGAH